MHSGCDFAIFGRKSIYKTANFRPVCLFSRVCLSLALMCVRVSGNKTAICLHLNGQNRTRLSRPVLLWLRFRLDRVLWLFVVWSPCSLGPARSAQTTKAHKPVEGNLVDERVGQFSLQPERQN